MEKMSGSIRTFVSCRYRISRPIHSVYETIVSVPRLNAFGGSAHELLCAERDSVDRFQVGYIQSAGATCSVQDLMK